MEPYMFTNGLPILFYCDRESLLKIRQLSKAMRKRVFYILKDKILLVKKDLSNRATKLSKWICKQTNSNSLFYGTHPFKHIERKDIFGEFDFNADILVEEHGDIPPERQPFKKTCYFHKTDDSFPSLYFDRIYRLDCFRETIQIMPKHTFELVDNLILPKEQYPETKEALQRIKRVTKALSVEFFPDLSGINWLKTLKILTIDKATITTELELPNLTKMTYNRSRGLYKLKCPKLEYFSGWDFDDDPKELAQFTNLKILKLACWCFYGKEHFLPRELRHINADRISRNEKFSIEPVIKQCSKLFSFNCHSIELDIKCYQGTNLRKICMYPYKTKLKGKSTVRLKYAEINSYNSSFFNKHPELISKAIDFYIGSLSFDWKFLPDGYKKIRFCSSKIFGEKRIDKYIDKLRGIDILSITVEKACSARKIMKIVLKVKEIRCNEELEELREEFEGSGCYFNEVEAGAEKEKNCCIF